MSAGWTIEHGPEETPVYLTPHFSWANDREKAIRFAREQDADALILANSWNGFRVRPMTDAGASEDLVERVTKAMYDDRPMTAISPALAELAGVPENAPITWERSIEMGADHSGMRRLARAAIAYLESRPSDHALIGWAMCVQDATWEEWGPGKGEFCFAGMRYATALDEFGCPILTAALRAAIVKARQ